MVIVIGSGATGLGVAWDLTLRGIRVTVVEADEIGSGTSGRFHGLLHSGARYVVTDPISAKQCRDENIILRQIVPSAVKTVGGYFVSVDEAGESFIPKWQEAASATGVPIAEVPTPDLLRRLPGLNPEVSRGFFVQDAVLEGFKVLQLLEEHLERQGATLLTHTRVTGVQTHGGRVAGVTVRSGSYDRLLPCDAVVNASGPWAGAVARFFDDKIRMHLAAGLMLIYANRMVPHIVNRLALPGDGDILVPHGRTVILGTTEVEQETAEAPAATREEAAYLQKLGQQLFPEMDRWRVLRAFTGVRPLFNLERSPGVTSPVHVSRDFSVLDHASRTGLEGAFSIVGGKWTTYRLMAERTGDVVARYLGIDRRSLAAETPLEPGLERDSGGEGPVICECEGVRESELVDRLDQSLEQWRTHTWFAMGPCQGTICAHRAVALRVPRLGVERSIGDLEALRAERDRGMLPVAWGDNAREVMLKEAIAAQTLAEGELFSYGR